MNQMDKVEKHIKESGYEYTKLDEGGLSLKSEFYELTIRVYRRRILARLLRNGKCKESAYGPHMSISMADIFVKYKDLIDSIERMSNESLGLPQHFKIENEENLWCRVVYSNSNIDFSFRTVIVPMVLGFEPSRYVAPVECSVYVGEINERKFIARSCGSDLRELFNKVVQESLDTSIHDLQKAYGTTQHIRDIKTLTSNRR
jgi:hypothetical protein